MSAAIRRRFKQVRVGVAIKFFEIKPLSHLTADVGIVATAFNKGQSSSETVLPPFAIRETHADMYSC
jgi:hypothetical protein